MEHPLLWRVWERMLRSSLSMRASHTQGQTFVSPSRSLSSSPPSLPERSPELILTAVTARRSGRRAYDRPRSLCVLGRHTQGDRPARSRARDLLHDCASASVCARGGDHPGRSHEPLVQSRGLFSLRESHGLCDAPRKGCLFAGPYTHVACGSQAEEPRSRL